MIEKKQMAKDGGGGRGREGEVGDGRGREGEGRGWKGRRRGGGGDEGEWHVVRGAKPFSRQ
jgi:hypothetical protein